MGEAATGIGKGEARWGATVQLRYRKVSFGRPVMQQRWVRLGKMGEGEVAAPAEWRDVPVEAVE